MVFNSPTNTHFKGKRSVLPVSSFPAFEFFFCWKTKAQTEVSDDLLQECIRKGNGLRGWTRIFSPSTTPPLSFSYYLTLLSVTVERKLCNNSDPKKLQGFWRHTPKFIKFFNSPLKMRYIQIQKNAVKYSVRWLLSLITTIQKKIIECFHHPQNSPCPFAL